MGRPTPETAGGDKPQNHSLGDFKVLQEQRRFGSGYKKPESQSHKQLGVPENREQILHRERLIAERARAYLRTATKIWEASASQSGTHDPKELQIVAELLSMRGLALGEALSIIEGKDKELGDEVEQLEKSLPHYKANIVAEFFDEKKRPNT